MASIDLKPSGLSETSRWLRAIARPVAYVCANYFRSPLDAAISLICIAALMFLVIVFGRWAFVDSVWHARNGTECLQHGSGACWAVISARSQLLLFGLYPYSDIWRPTLAALVLFSAFGLSCRPIFWQIWRLLALWLFAFTVYIILMRGGLFGLSFVADVYWGGMALTFLVFGSMMVFGMPLACLLTLARHFGPQWLRQASAIVIDAGRALPLVTILFAFWLAAPILLPSWMQVSTLSRAIIGFVVFFACYEAEILRGGLQAIGRGQIEAALALGLRFWMYQITVILPQVFRLSLPQTVNLVVGCFKDTSYIAILGFFDMVAAANAAVGTGDWYGQYIEVYVVVALFYLVFGTLISLYGSYLERRLAVGRPH